MSFVSTFAPTVFSGLCPIFGPYGEEDARLRVSSTRKHRAPAGDFSPSVLRVLPAAGLGKGKSDLFTLVF